MMNRENLIYIKNILSLHNDDIQLNKVYDILTAIKEGDEFSFYTLLLKYTNPDIDTRLLHSVLKTISQNPELTNEILDSFSKNQFAAKGQLLEVVDQLQILDHTSEVIIFGCWYGSILIPALSPNVKRITGIDLDDRAIKVAKNSFFKNYNNVDFITDDVFSKFRGRYSETKLFINTSCEHMLPMNTWPWWGRVRSNTYFAFQSNNMSQINGHVNCVQSLEEFKTQLPPNSEVLFEDELEDERGTRYTLVGKIALA